MADQFLGEIRIFSGNFAPTGWAFCNGQLLPISQNTALFSLLGTYYGGNGTTNFALPNLQGAAPMHTGNGTGLTPRLVGDTGGEASVTLQTSQLPMHTHTLNGTAATATTTTPQGALPAIPDVNPRFAAIYGTGAPNAAEASATVGTAGGGAAHNNLQPYLTLNFIIAMQGIYPPRS